MNKKICFSSVLKQKQGSQNILNKQASHNSLRSMMEAFKQFPKNDYTLRYYSNNSLKACNSKQGFDEGYNQLDQWINQQKYHHQIDKENISDTQPRRQREIPNGLLKYANGPKSPRRLSQAKPDMVPHQNAAIKQICQTYMEGLKFGRDMKNAPVWRFNKPAIQDQEHDEQFQNQSKRNNYNQIEEAFRESVGEERARPKLRQNHPVTEMEKVTSSKSSTQMQPKGQNMLKIVEKIKTNLVPQIRDMAIRIAQDKLAGQAQDQELLISQRESEEQRGQRRMEEKLKQEVGEYLTRKNTGSDQISMQTASVPTKKIQIQSFDKNQEKTSHQHVGYSFSSDFQNPNMPQQNNGSMQKEEDQSRKTNKQTKSYLDPCNKISLPNIDEVKSERDGMEKVEEYFGEPVQPPLSKPPIQSSIDKNFIKQIQSVAYVGPTEQVEIFANKPKHEEINRERKQIETVEKERKSSLFQQISKTAMSIEGIQDNISVNVSVAEVKESPVKQQSRQGSARDHKVITTIPVETSSFVSPAPAVKIQFNKVPSPQRVQKQEQKVSIKPIQTNQSFQTLAPSTMPLIQPITTFNYSIGPKTSFGNILQETEKEGISTANHQSTSNNPTHPQASNYQQQYQNSRERTNSLKNSNQEDQGRKIKITISPKYHGKEEDKYENIGHVADFKLNNAKMEESSDPLKHPQTTLKVSTTTNPNSAVSIPAKQSMGGEKVKIDAMFTNVRNLGNTIVTETREIHQESRERPQQHALIRVEKYERVEKIVEPSKTNKQSISQRNNASIKNSQQFQFDLDF